MRTSPRELTVVPAPDSPPPAVRKPVPARLRFGHRRFRLTRRATVLLGVLAVAVVAVPTTIAATSGGAEHRAVLEPAHLRAAAGGGDGGGNGNHGDGQHAEQHGRPASEAELTVAESESSGHGLPHGRRRGVRSRDDGQLPRGGTHRLAGARHRIPATPRRYVATPVSYP